MKSKIVFLIAPFLATPTMADTYSLIPLSTSTYIAPNSNVPISSQDVLILDQDNGHLDYCVGSLNTIPDAKGNLSVSMFCAAEFPNLNWSKPAFPFPKNAPAVSSSAVPRGESTLPGFWAIDASENLTLCIKGQFGPPETNWYCLTMNGLPHGGEEKEKHLP